MNGMLGEEGEGVYRDTGVRGMRCWGGRKGRVFIGIWE